MGADGASARGRSSAAPSEQARGAGLPPARSLDSQRRSQLGAAPRSLGGSTGEASALPRARSVTTPSSASQRGGAFLVSQGSNRGLTPRGSSATTPPFFSGGGGGGAATPDQPVGILRSPSTTSTPRAPQEAGGAGSPFAPALGAAQRLGGGGRSVAFSEPPPQGPDGQAAGAAAPAVQPEEGADAGPPAALGLATAATIERRLSIRWEDLMKVAAGLPAGGPAAEPPAGAEAAGAGPADAAGAEDSSPAGRGAAASKHPSALAQPGGSTHPLLRHADFSQSTVSRHADAAEQKRAADGPAEAGLMAAVPEAEEPAPSPSGTAGAASHAASETASRAGASRASRPKPLSLSILNAGGGRGGRSGDDFALKLHGAVDDPESLEQAERAERAWANLRRLEQLHAQQSAAGRVQQLAAALRTAATTAASFTGDLPKNLAPLTASLRGIRGAGVIGTALSAGAAAGAAPGNHRRGGVSPQASGHPLEQHSAPPEAHHHHHHHPPGKLGDYSGPLQSPAADDWSPDPSHRGPRPHHPGHHGHHAPHHASTSPQFGAAATPGGARTPDGIHSARGGGGGRSSTASFAGRSSVLPGSAALPPGFAALSETAAQRNLFLLGSANPLRLHAGRLLRHPHFDWLVTACISVSSVCSALDKPRLDPRGPAKRALFQVEVIFSAVFCAEALLKMVSQGLLLHRGAYLRTRWGVFEAAVALSGLLHVVLPGDEDSGSAFLVVGRTVRVLRVLRLANRVRSLRVVTDSLTSSLGGYVNVLIFAVLVYLGFGILGMNLFQGRLWYCEDANGNLIDPRHYGGPDITREWCGENGGSHWLLCPAGVGEPRLYPGASAAAGASRDAWACAPALPPAVSENANTGLREVFGARWTCVPDNVTTGPFSEPVTSLCPPLALIHRWRNPAVCNFDNIGWAALCLFELASLESWTDVQYLMSSAVAVGQQPRRDYNIYAMFYAFLFIILGSYFLINLFVGVTIDRYERLKERADMKAILNDEEQYQWFLIRRMVFGAAPRRRKAPPAGAARRRLHAVAASGAFDRIVLACIVLNMGVLAAQHQGMGRAWSSALTALNDTFTFAFLAEAALKLAALGQRGYFLEASHAFDLAVALLSLAGTLAGFLDLPGVTLLSVMRILRLFRLIPRHPGLLKLFKTLVRGWCRSSSLQPVLIACVLTLLTHTTRGIRPSSPSRSGSPCPRSSTS